jgi:hypothetical protein
MTSELAEFTGTDAVWKPLQGQQATHAGIGIFIQNPGMTHCSSIFSSAKASSSLQAQVLGIYFATEIAELLCSQQPVFLTDNKTLASAGTTNEPVDALG